MDYVERVKQVVEIANRERVVERLPENTRAERMGSIVLPDDGDLFLYAKRWGKRNVLERGELKEEVAFYKVLSDRGFDIPYFTAFIQFPNGFSGLLTEDLRRDDKIEMIDPRAYGGLSSLCEWLVGWPAFEGISREELNELDENNEMDREKLKFCNTAYALAELFKLSQGYMISRGGEDISITGMLYLISEAGKGSRFVVGDGKILQPLKEEVKMDVERVIETFDDSWVVR